jgi:hypothetical protein
MTKGEVLRYAIAFALRRLRNIIRGLKEGLTEEERYSLLSAYPPGANIVRSPAASVVRTLPHVRCRSPFLQAFSFGAGPFDTPSCGKLRI